MEQRWMEGTEAAQKLNPILKAEDWTPLDPRLTRANTILQGSEVLGLLVYRLFPVIGPLWVHPDFRNGELSKAMVRAMLEFLNRAEVPGYLVIADNPVSERFCRLQGMKKVESPVYRKE